MCGAIAGTHRHLGHSCRIAAISLDSSYCFSERRSRRWIVSERSMTAFQRCPLRTGSSPCGITFRTILHEADQRDPQRHSRYYEPIRAARRQAYSDYLESEMQRIAEDLRAEEEDMRTAFAAEAEADEPDADDDEPDACSAAEPYVHPLIWDAAPFFFTACATPA
jgi:hypothetical protein